MRILQYVTDPFKFRLEFSDQELADLSRAAKFRELSNVKFIEAAIEIGIEGSLEEDADA